MIRVHCRTNLDLVYERWPEFLPAAPVLGDEIFSKTIHPSKFQLKLQVVSRQWKPDSEGKYALHVELHMTNSQMRLPSKNGDQGSITAFYEWYAPLVGRSVSSFI